MNPWMDKAGIDYDPFAPDSDESDIFANALPDDEEVAGDYTPYGSDNTGAPSAILSDKKVAPPVTGGNMPAVAPDAVLRAMQMPVAQNPNPAPVVNGQQPQVQRPQFRSDAYDKLTAHDAAIPMLQKPKLWQRIAAGLLGAGSAVAASQATPGVSRPDTGAIGMATQALLNPGRQREMQNWQMQRQVLKDQLGAEQSYNSNIIRSGQLDETRRRNDMMLESIKGKNQYYDKVADVKRLHEENASRGTAKLPTNWEQQQVAEYYRLKNSGDPVLMDQAERMKEEAYDAKRAKTIPAAHRIEVLGRTAELMKTGLDEESAKQQAEIEIANAAKTRRGKQNELTDASVGAAKSRSERDTAQAEHLRKLPSGKPVSQSDVDKKFKGTVQAAYAKARSEAGGDADKAIELLKTDTALDEKVRNAATSMLLTDKEKKKKSNMDELRKLVGGGNGDAKPTPGQPAQPVKATRLVYDSKLKKMVPATK